MINHKTVHTQTYSTYKPSQEHLVHHNTWHASHITSITVHTNHLYIQIRTDQTDFPQNPLKIDMQDDIALITTLKLRILQEPSKKQTKTSLNGFAGTSPESPENSDTTDIYVFLCRIGLYSFPVASLRKLSFKLAGERAEIGRRKSGYLAGNRSGGFSLFFCFV